MQHEAKALQRVYAIDDPDDWWVYRDLGWHARANTGIDHEGHLVRAWIDGSRLRVQHGFNQAEIAWFTLDELNYVGGHWRDGDVVLAWCDEIDGAARHDEQSAIVKLQAG